MSTDNKHASSSDPSKLGAVVLDASISGYGIFSVRDIRNFSSAV
jgi:hypothetical protein